MNRWSLEKSLLEKSNGAIKPWEIGQFTLAEILMFLEDPEKRAPSGLPNMSDTEMTAAFEIWQALTPLERLDNVLEE